MSPNTKKLNLSSPGVRQVLFTLVSIFVGLLVGAIILTCTGFNPFSAYNTLLKGVFGQPKYIAWTVIYATPVIFTGLSVTFAFRTGLFNIGAEGQYIVGSLAAVLVGAFVEAPFVLHGLLCLIAGALAGACWAGIAGILKAKKGISEVITSIMLNWTALYFSNYVLMNTPLRRPNSEASVPILPTAKINIESLKHVFGPATRVNMGIVIAVASVIIIYIIINKTTLGYRLRAVGFNQSAAVYGGINVTRSIVASMAIAGLLAGLAGAVQVTGVQHAINLLAGQEGYGFNGLSVSMIGGNHPFGVFLAGLFFGALQYGGSKLNTVGVPSELISIIIGCIMYVIAIPNAINQLMKFFKAKKKGEPS